MNPNLKPFTPGNSGNPKGRPKNAGSSIREYLNARADETVAEIRRIARDARTPTAKRAAAIQWLHASDSPTLADFAELIDGTKTLRQLETEGIDTGAIRKFKRTKRRTRNGGEVVTVEIQLHDRSNAVERILNHTGGRVLAAREYDFYLATLDESDGQVDDVLLILRGEYPHLLPHANGDAATNGEPGKN